MRGDAEDDTMPARGSRDEIELAPRRESQQREESRRSERKGTKVAIVQPLEEDQDADL